MKQKERIKRHHMTALEAERKRLRAEQDSHMKSAFLSNMSQYVLKYGLRRSDKDAGSNLSTEGLMLRVAYLVDYAANVIGTCSELRTPLNGLIGTTELLSGTPLNDEQRDYCRTMEVCSRTLLHVINDILDFSKIQAGRVDLDYSPFSLDMLIYDVFVMSSVKV
jgi:signal transduction histidine kinase